MQELFWGNKRCHFNRGGLIQGVLEGGSTVSPSSPFFFSFSRGPKEADEFAAKLGFMYSQTYKWTPSPGPRL